MSETACSRAECFPESFRGNTVLWRNIIKSIKEKLSAVAGFFKKIDYSRLNYFPFVGWIYPFAAKYDDEFVYFHARQGFVTAAVFTAIPVTLSVMIFVSPFEVKMVEFVLTVMIYLSHYFYFFLCVWGSVMMLKGVKGGFPGISRVSRKLNV